MKTAPQVAAPLVGANATVYHFLGGSRSYPIRCKKADKMEAIARRQATRLAELQAVFDEAWEGADTTLEEMLQRFSERVPEFHRNHWEGDTLENPARRYLTVMGTEAQQAETRAKQARWTARLLFPVYVELKKQWGNIPQDPITVEEWYAVYQDPTWAYPRTTEHARMAVESTWGMDVVRAFTQGKTAAEAERLLGDFSRATRDSVGKSPNPMGMETVQKEALRRRWVDWALAQLGLGGPLYFLLQNGGMTEPQQIRHGSSELHGWRTVPPLTDVQTKVLLALAAEVGIE